METKEDIKKSTRKAALAGWKARHLRGDRVQLGHARPVARSGNPAHNAVRYAKGHADKRIN